MKRFMIAAAVTLCVAAQSCSLQAGLLDDVFQAGPLKDVMSIPRQVVNVELNRLTFPLIDLSRAMPSPDELNTVPMPRPNQVLGYPVELVNYGLSVYPPVRVLRQNLGRL